MAENHEEIKGKRFGSLVAVELAGRNRAWGRVWRCTCDCGTDDYLVRESSLLDGGTRSCGCLSRKNGERRRIYDTPDKQRLRNIWTHMNYRCYKCKPSHKNYKEYRLRGIQVCDEWRNDFWSFYEWAMSHGYDCNMSIDRIDVDGNYCPENCRWITMDAQARNKTSSRMVTMNGETRCVAEWAEALGLNRMTLTSRINSGWTYEEIVKGSRDTNKMGSSVPEHVRRKMAENRKDYVPVIGTDKFTGVEVSFKSITDASVTLGISYNAIFECAHNKGRRKSAGGYTWRLA